MTRWGRGNIVVVMSCSWYLQWLQILAANVTMALEGKGRELTRLPVSTLVPESHVNACRKRNETGTVGYHTVCM